MTTLSYETQHDATNGPASADFFISKFSETEGIEQANLMAKHMRITLECTGAISISSLSPGRKTTRKMVLSKYHFVNNKLKQLNGDSRLRG